MRANTFLSFLKYHTIIISFILLFLTCLGCDESRKNNSNANKTTEQSNVKESVMGKIFKVAYNNKKTMYDVIRIPEIKNYIISYYSQKFYDQLIHYVQVVSPIVYNNGVYTMEGFETHLYSNIAKCSYNSINEELSFSLTLDGCTVQSNGEIYYNTEGWHISYEDYKNDFGEIVRREPVAGYRIENEEDELLAPDKIFFVVRPQYLTLWTNLWGSNDSVKDIRIKDNITDKIYMIDFEDHYHLKNEGLYRDNIGVFIFGDEYKKFIQLISSLDDYVISIRSVYGQNLILRNPENLNNILDTYKKILSMPRK